MNPMDERLNDLRVTLGTDWGGLASALGISRSMLGFLRSGERKASPKLLRVITDKEAETTEDLRKRSAEMDERIKLLELIAMQEEIIGLLEGNRLLRVQAKESEQEALKAKADALAAAEALRLEREERETISAPKAGAV